MDTTQIILLSIGTLVWGVLVAVAVYVTVKLKRKKLKPMLGVVTPQQKRGKK